MQTKKQKKPAVALLLGLFFGPLGIFYGSPLIAAILTVIGIIVFFVGGWLGMIIYWPVCVMVSWAVVYFENHSQSIKRS
jgi:hypothetical protein